MKRPRILALSSRVPYPLAGGDRLRVYHVLRGLQEAGDVELLCLSEGPADAEALAHLRSRFSAVTAIALPKVRYRAKAFASLWRPSVPLQVGYYRFAEVQSWVDAALSRCDLGFAFHVRMTEYLRHAQVPRMVDLVDAISLNYRRALDHGVPLAWRAIYQLEVPRLERYEVATTRRFDRSYVVAHADRDHLLHLGADGDRVRVLENGTDIPERAAAGSTAEDIDLVFVGNMETQSNRAAVAFFVNQVLPILQNSGDRPTFYVVGIHPSAETRKFADGKWIVVTGAVTDPSDYLRRAKVVVAPMVFGAGVQNKILEGMAWGKAVVTTPIGAAGLDAVNGTHLLVESSPTAMAAAIRRLLNDASRRQILGAAAAAHIRARYTWDRLVDQIRRDVLEILKIA